MSTLDLANLPAPGIIEPLDYEGVLAELKADLVARAPELAPVIALESEPVVKLMEVFAYREVLVRARVNAAARGTMLAYATGTDLDNLAALFGVTRLVVTPADPTAIPPTPAIHEADADLRRRVLLSLDGQSAAGPRAAYEFHARSADGRIKDVSVTSATPGQVDVVIFATESDGTITSDPVPAVEAALNDEDVRPLTIVQTVSAATQVPFDVTATLIVEAGADASLVEAEAAARLDSYLETARRIGRDLPLSGLYAALHAAGVVEVQLAEPAADVAIGPGEIAIVDTITLTRETVT